MTLSLDDINLLAGTWGRGVPHDQFDRLRKEAPVYWHPEPADTGFWALTKYDDVKRCSHDWRTFSSRAELDTPPLRLIDTGKRSPLPRKSRSLLKRIDPG